MDVSPAPVRPRFVVQRAMEVARPLAESKGLAVKVEADSVPTINSDPDKIHQILLNLLSNAVKFTDKGEIAVRLREEKGRVLFSVRDTGIGMSPNQWRTSSMSSGRWTDPPRAARRDGAGLGDRPETGPPAGRRNHG